MHSRSCFKASFCSQHVNGYQGLLKPAREYFYRNFSTLRHRQSYKTALLLRFEILGLLLDRLTADPKYYRHNTRNLLQPNRKKIKLECRKLLLWNTLRESTCSRVLNTAEIYTAALLY